MLGYAIMLQYVQSPNILGLYNKLHGFLSFFRLMAGGSRAPAAVDTTPKEHELGFLERINLLEFIEMADNAYYDHDLDTLLSKFGYDKDGLRVKVFEYDDDMVIAFKGTTLSLMGVEMGRTSKKDKMLDEILYSRCKENDNNCREQKAKDFHDLGYFNDAVDILNAVRTIHHNKGLILTGHSLGGTLASLMGIKHELPVVAFASAGDAHIADILGFYNVSKEYSNIVHIGMCNDTVFRGECNRSYSPCNILGYNIETKCHVGRSLCIKDSGHNNLMYHSMSVMKAKIRSFSEVTLIENFQNMNCTY